MTDPIEERVIAIVANSAGVSVASVTPEATFKSLNIASLDAIEIIFNIEEALGVTLSDRTPDHEADTVRGLIDAVRAALPEAGAAGALERSQ